MDFPLSSSVILMVAVALWIVWVAPYVLRNRRQQFQVAGESAAEAADFETQEPQAGSALMLAAQQEKPMDISQSTSPAAGRQTAPISQTGPDRRRNDPGTGRLRIRYGRLTIALIGLVLLVAVPVTGALRVLGIGSMWLPIISLFGAAGAVLILRRLAVRDRRARVSAAFHDAMAAPATKPARESAEEAPADRPDTPVFDAEAHRPAPAPLTAVELRQAALAVAAAAGDESARAARDSGENADESPWEPVEVPKPTYVDAAKAERPAPEPLDLPEAPKPVGKPSLKQGTAGSKNAEPGIVPTAARAAGAAKGQNALSNLDVVLQRRRA